MNSPTNPIAPFGVALKLQRTRRRWSQMQLAEQANVSQRHLSFLESGRSSPSRDMIVQLSEALALPLRAQNALLSAAGYSGLYAERNLSAADMTPVRDAIDMMLEHHNPFPALAVDRAWNLLMMNRTQKRMLDLLGGADKLFTAVGSEVQRNIVKLLFHPKGLRPFIANMDEIAPLFLARTAHEAIDYPQLQPVLDEALGYPGIPKKWKNIEAKSTLPPVISTVFDLGSTQLKMFTVLSTFGTAQDITADEIRIESFFPADESTRAIFETQFGA